MVAAVKPKTATPITARLIPVVWITDPAEADRLLGEEYRYLLDEVLENFRQAAPEHGWPLTHIEIEYYQDMEFEWWEDLVLVLHFDCPWEEAEQHCDAGLRAVVGPFYRQLEPELKSRFTHRFIKGMAYDFDSSS